MKAKKKNLVQASFKLKIVDDLLEMDVPVPDARISAVDSVRGIARYAMEYWKNSA